MSSEKDCDIELDFIVAPYECKTEEPEISLLISTEERQSHTIGSLRPRVPIFDGFDNFFLYRNDVKTPLSSALYQSCEKIITSA